VLDSSLQSIAQALLEMRTRTFELLDPLDDSEMETQFDSLMSPLVWDLGHIGNVEETWLVQALYGRPPHRPALDRLYNPMDNPRGVRGQLSLPSRRETERYVASVRHEVLALLPKLDLDDGERLLAEGYVFNMVLQHEAQHQETMLQALDLRTEGRAYAHPARQRPPEPRPVDDDERIQVPAGACRVGTSDTSRAYDNERPAHEVELPAFEMDRFPVTVRRWLEFMGDHGYERPELWSGPGRAWLHQTGHRSPQGWALAGADGWRARRFGHWIWLDPREPVQHVCFWEAEAFARWAGARLPIEAEWEKAASWDPHAGRARMYPWGDLPPTPKLANLDQRAWGPAPVGSYPLGASAYGVEQLLGDVYQWTSSEFVPYAGFQVFPYPEYSAAFFHRGYRVLRGASWAIRPLVARNTYRNWDLPQRRQIFAGVRLVWNPT
jgi:gamma-glutamyl hercynylcysteine S-oxide synthase